ncbi:hypothetical protein [Paenibacillus sp. JDR-2]|uniref:hypothetical protein n=1 Tax=Paenibacillus sp. (strain JDR-2) TaxID=324057 RepID=UPI000166A1A3|nr:hypothetical protein [Paenibacillus sp. JDR-2]
MTTVQSAYQEEQERLARSLDDIKSQLAGIGPRYTGDDFTEQMLDLQREERKQRLEVAFREPYFGRIDFEELPVGEKKPLYIGKAGVAKQGSNELLVIDWACAGSQLVLFFYGRGGCGYIHGAGRRYRWLCASETQFYGAAGRACPHG